MSDFQIALIAVGAIIIGLVLGYNRLQERNYRRQLEKTSSPDHEDAQSEEIGRASDSPEMGPGLIAAAQDREHEPSLEQEGSNSAAVEVRSLRRQPSPCSPIDHCVDLCVKNPISSTLVIEAAVKLLVDFTKAVRLEGYDSDSGQWKSLGHAHSVVDLRGSIQLVDRRGRISDVELARFDTSVRQLATAVGAIAYPSKLEDSIALATDLNRFCEAVDLQVGLNIVPKEGAFIGAHVLEAARSLKMDFGPDGVLYKRDAAGKTLFRLASVDGIPLGSVSSDSNALSALTLEIDVPRTVRRDGLIEELFRTALDLASLVKGKVVDDNRLEVGDAAIKAIYAQLDMVYGLLERRGIAAGEPLALRLFC